MTFHAPGVGSTLVFLLIVAFVILAFLWANVRAWRLARMPFIRQTLYLAAATFLWLAVISLPVVSGFMAAQPMPRLPLFFAAGNLLALVLALGPMGKRLSALPLSLLVGFHAFRLPLELVLHEWAAQGSIPVTMTWSLANFDVISGLIAIPCALLAKRLPAAAWAFNSIGFALLLNVMRVALLSSPLPFAWKVDPPLQLAFHLPYAWIGPVCVAGALMGHVVLTRALLRKPA